jgi:hypothetical protein
MITSVGTRNVISSEDLLTRVRDKENIDQKVLEDALRALEQDTKLVRRERRHDTHFYEIVSEFLVPWIRGKKIERDASIERRKLEEAERRNRRKAFAWAGVILVIGLAVGAFAVRELRQRTKDAIATTKVQEALDNQRVAEEQREKALSKVQEADHERQNAENAKADVEKNLEASIEEKKQLALQVNKLKADLEGSRVEPSTLDDTIAVLYQKLDEVNTERERFQYPKNVQDELNDLRSAIEEVRKAINRRK